MSRRSRLVDHANSLSKLDLAAGGLQSLRGESRAISREEACHPLAHRDAASASSGSESRTFALISRPDDRAGPGCEGTSIPSQFRHGRSERA